MEKCLCNVIILLEFSPFTLKYSYNVVCLRPLRCASFMGMARPIGQRFDVHRPFSNSSGPICLIMYSTTALYCGSRRMLKRVKHLWRDCQSTARSTETMARPPGGMFLFLGGIATTIGALRSKKRIQGQSATSNRIWGAAAPTGDATSMHMVEPGVLQHRLETNLHACMRRCSAMAWKCLVDAAVARTPTLNTFAKTMRTAIEVSISGHGRCNGWQAQV